MTDKKNAPKGFNKNRFLISEVYQKNLIQANRFVCYKADKRPYNAETKKLAKVTDSNDFRSFDYACNSVKNNPDFEGIGFISGKENDISYCGLDIDDCIDSNGVISTEAKEIIDLLDTYTEISRSGNGIHCLFIAEKPKGRCVNRNLSFCSKFELYDKHHFALTGNIIKNKDLEYRQKECETLYNKYLKHLEKSYYKESSDITRKEITTQQINDYLVYINKVVEGGKDKIFTDIWLGNRKNDDESENDFCLFKKLSHYCHCNPDLIEAVAFGSPFYKTKKDDETTRKEVKGKFKWLKRKDSYLRRSILNAINYYQSNLNRGINN